MTYETCPMVAARWGVTRARVHQLVAEGRIVAQRVGRDWLIYGRPERTDIVHTKKRVDTA